MEISISKIIIIMIAVFFVFAVVPFWLIAGKGEKRKENEDAAATEQGKIRENTEKDKR